ncbi:alpha-amylase family glycosyl hydrolase [Deminuibacter soli]|uniref:1,4-alpha-glucan branching protein n=1 Tax=Deminuibacter soli TaxID=2291815 RepID=A0A3E1NLR7_9BACT|nr:alpha-amylase family glycosyl hydrolase [Deminuibacter soli]RFM28875.1 1,4-alpha-glucan branching protein [Deminuibacter soli]
MSKLYTTVEWANGANIYEVNVRQYTQEGTFKAFAAHLPRLRDMGVEIVWLMPITPISREKRLGTMGSYYACSSYTGINPEFGTPDDFKQLVQQVHSLGMKIIIDWVANHTGYDHEWTKLHPDWFVQDAAGNFVEINGWNDVIDLDYKNEDMRREMIRCMQYWVTECGIDGFRCDMAHLVPLDFWKAARIACDAVTPLFWLAECDVIDYADVFDVNYAWDWMHKTEAYFKQKISLQDCVKSLDTYFNYPKGSAKLLFTTNHDENSWNGTEYEKYNGGARALAVLSCTWPGIPLVYSGQEIPNLVRLPFFEKGALQWNGTPLLHGFYQVLLQERRLNKALQNGSNFIRLDVPHDKVLAWLQVKDNQKLLVALNLSATDRLRFQLKHDQLPGTYRNIFSGLEQKMDGVREIELQAWEYIVYSCRN